MDLKQLQYFLTIVEEGSITAAAARLHVTQPPGCTSRSRRLASS
ncbi:LysR family transcriptional regulator [[Clostridium] symbiosum]|nr:LysR family transcriptional regulator [[Clostridium] symbiosum]